MTLRATIVVGGVAIVLAVAGCGDDGDGPGPASDGGVGVDGSTGIAPPVAPMEPAAPAPVVMTPCRSGWREVDGPEGLRVCEPFPEPRPVCAAGEALFPGGAGCEPIGGACPAGEWADGLPATGVIYVRAGGGMGGAGTRDDPYPTIAAALAARTGGEIIALGKGTYDEGLVLRADAEIVGACAAQTRWGSSLAAIGYGVVEVNAGTVRIADVTISAPRRQGLRFEGAGVVGTVEGVAIEGVAVVALSVFSGARVTARDLVIRDTLAHDDGTAGRGIGLEAGGVLTLERAVLDGNRSEGIAVLGEGCELHASDLLVARTRRSADDFADGITASAGGLVEGDGVVIEDNPLVGVLVLVGAPRVSLSNSVVRGNGASGIQIGPEASGTLARVRIEENAGGGLLVQESTVEATDLISRGNGGRGLVVQNGAMVDVHRAVVSENAGTGVIAAGTTDPARLGLEDAVLRDNEGRSIQVQEGARATLARIESSGALGTEMVIRGAGVTVQASDLFLHDSRPETGVTPEADRARGLEVRVGADAVVDRIRIERAYQVGIFVEDATATMHDVTVTDTGARDDIVPDMGRGIEIQRSIGPGSTLERVALLRNGGAGMVVGGGSLVTVRDLLVADTRATGIQRASGKGLVANGGSTLTLDRVRLERNREVSLAAFQAGTRIEGTAVAILESLERECVVDTCPEYGAGIGAGVYIEAFLRLDGFVVDRTALVGVQIESPSVELHRGTIARSRIGLNVLGEGVDFMRVLDQVAMVDNERNIDAMLLPLPDSTLPPVDE